MKIAIYTRQKNSIILEDLKNLLLEISKYDLVCLLHKNFQHFLKDIHIAKYKIDFKFFSSANDLDNDVEAVLSVGGDGTLLDVVTLIKEKPLPILGINFGRLGFLAVVGKESLTELFRALVDKTYFIEERMLLHADTSLENKNNQFDKIPFALNDCVIRGYDNSSMINVKTYLNGEYLTSYWGDGVIISTPTGSTGYSLSCQGPVIFPDINSLLITPIAAHNLNCRPIIVSENSVISISVETRSSKFVCSLDSRHFEFNVDVRIAIKKECFKIRLIRLTEKTFLNILKRKLNWGFDNRTEKIEFPV